MSNLPKQFYVALHLCGMLRAWLGKLIVNHDRFLVVAHDAVRSLLYGRPVGRVILEDGALVIEFPSWAKPLGHGGIGKRGFHLLPQLCDEPIVRDDTVRNQLADVWFDVLLCADRGE